MPRQSEPRGVRHAALLLHAMAPADRSWMLDALPQQERAELAPLLEELEALGIERDPALIDAATSGDELAAPAYEIVVGTPRPAATSDEAMLHALDVEQVPTLADIFRTEPAGLVAELLSLADWPWREALLQAMEPVQRRKIEAHLAATTPASQTPPGLRAALISMVAARLRGRPSADGPSSSRWRKLRHSLVNAIQGARRGASR
ncbi:hypothetical protein ACSFBF_19210 [Variovorax sp. ZT5P49]|uniref:hypothetical protein n=1 Tax=Variovorax sp. ZT5P49 TaxID=3443733 RepID=UPI003F481543